MEIKKYNTFLKKNEILVELQLDKSISLVDLSIFSSLFTNYAREVIYNSFGFENEVEQFVTLPNFTFRTIASSGRDFKKNMSIYTLIFHVEVIDVDDKDVVNNVHRAIKEVLKFRKIDDTYTKVNNDIDLICNLAKSKNSYSKLNDEIIQKALFNGVEYSVNNQSNVRDEKVIEGGKQFVVNAFNNIAGCLKDSVVELNIEMNTINEDYEKIGEIFADQFKEKENGEYKEISYNFGEVEAEYKLEKNTSNSIFIYELSGFEDLYSETLSKLYLDDYIRKFYLNEIRLKHNLIYSPVLRKANDYSMTNHEVKNENLDFMVKLEDEFFANISNSLDEDVLKNLGLGIKKTALTYYENHNWGSISYTLNSFGVDTKNLTVDEQYDKLVEISQNIDVSKIDVSSFNIIARTKINGG